MSKKKEIFFKIRKHGIKKSIKIFFEQLYTFLSVKMPVPLRISFYYNLLKLILVPSYKKKRILGIWDFKALPWSIGDPLVFIETLSVLKLKHNAEEIDICVVYDHDFPIGNRGKGIANKGDINISPENAQDYILEFLPLFATCLFLGSIYQFNSRKEFHLFLKANIGRYDIFPPLAEHLAEKFTFGGKPPILNPMQEFFNSNGYIPFLRVGERNKAWAQWLFINNLPEGAVPVTLSLKQTVHRVTDNADPDLWLSFIDRCKVDFPEVIFFIIGLRDEVFTGLRDRSNVIITKDFGTSVIEDLALIRASLMYMSTSSGVNTVAMFSDLPYLIVGFAADNYSRHGLKPDDKFSFVLDTQKIVSSEIVITQEFLFEEFKTLYLKLDKNEWRKKAQEKACKKHGHPTAKGVN